jgi:hypothetical protein
VPAGIVRLAFYGLRRPGKLQAFLQGSPDRKEKLLNLC